MAGQDISKQKSKIVFNPNTLRAFKKFLASTFNVPYKPHLGKYLRVYVDNELKNSNFIELTEKITQRLSGWKEKLLTQAGRLQLIKSVLSSTPLYRMGFSPSPRNTLIRWILR